jgi:uncharacterized membrane protein YeiH
MVIVFTIVFMTAFAGGTLRDLFLGRHPLFLIAKDHHAMTEFFMALVSPVISRNDVTLDRRLQIPDAFGLGLFAVVGAN